MPHFCLSCKRGVRANSKAIDCDSCGEWCHIRCGVPITHTEYEQLSSGKITFHWICPQCLKATEEPAVPVMESTRLSTGNETPLPTSSVLLVTESSINNPDCLTVVEVHDPDNLVIIQDLGSFTAEQIQQEESVEEQVVTLPRGVPDETTHEVNDPAGSLFIQDLGSFTVQPTQQEESVLGQQDVTPHRVDVPDNIIYEKVQAATSRGKTRLIDSFGYCYTQKPSDKTSVIYWRCSVRNKTTYCKATVIQRNDTYTRGSIPHICQPQPGQALASKISKAVKQSATEKVFDSAAQIVEEVMLDHMEDGELCQALPKPVNLAKRANRARQKLRPTEPTDLQFTLDQDYLPSGFLRADISVQGRRHIVMASDNMIALLQRAKTWYIDATFKVVKEPFSQLFTVHAFVR